jgi:hypothetical protein
VALAVDHHMGRAADALEPFLLVGMEMRRIHASARASCSATSKRTGFSNYIVSGSDGDFMRSIAQEVFGIPPERVIGSDSALE